MRTQELKIKSSMELRKFVESNKLRDKNSFIFFQARIILQTPKNFKEIISSVRIYFEGYDEYGSLIINDDKDYLDVNLYPTKFQAKHNDFVELKSGIQINGIHPSIGKYKIEIYPL